MTISNRREDLTSEDIPQATKLPGSLSNEKSVIKQIAFIYFYLEKQPVWER